MLLERLGYQEIIMQTSNYPTQSARYAIFCTGLAPLAFLQATTPSPLTSPPLFPCPDPAMRTGLGCQPSVSAPFGLTSTRITAKSLMNVKRFPGLMRNVYCSVIRSAENLKGNGLSRLTLAP